MCLPVHLYSFLRLIRLDDYTALKTMVLKDYDGSLVDILDVQMA